MSRRDRTDDCYGVLMTLLLWAMRNSRRLPDQRLDPEHARELIADQNGPGPERRAA